MKKKTSIHDIAKQLNVSSTTVSFVLNGKAEENRISKELQYKVLEYVKKVGYQPNQLAKSLRTGKSMILCMLVEDISDPFFSSISRIVETKAFEHGYKIFFASTENDTEKTKALIRVFRERQVDGYIIAPPPGIEEELQDLLHEKVPVIQFDRFLPEVKTTNVIIDNLGGAYSAVQHLQENGYQQIGFVTLESKQTQMQDRLNGYLKAIKEKKQKKVVLKVPYRNPNESTQEKVRLFLQDNPAMDALLFATNYLAIDGLVAIASLKLNIPGNIAVVGFDDNTHFSLFSPPITAVAQPVLKIAEEVVVQLMNKIKSSGKNPRKEENILLPTQLIVRKSSLAVPGKKLNARLENIKNESISS
ncbi:LacI family transcriptional regulator [Chitinophagaceae bacterium LB-8]|uniref:LacI family transcriptional regulator n=1 Tax=Paraflavisolibacter caeni TaxID=2982496 RepID=A0A9X3B9Z3_9BACT|nr:LacI family DNA-binding transcriptional regulator [Paraflavisolibacter caeni]MCU7552710.1 LacI family transcriptional regulator [Paraflavisolibacter caeni]